MNRISRRSSLEHSTAQNFCCSNESKPLHHEPFTADETLLMMEPELAAHPDYHDGWGAMRPREVELEPAMQASEAAQRLVAAQLVAAQARVRRLEEESARARVEARAARRNQSRLLRTAVRSRRLAVSASYA